jgi:hypothetical protein
LKTSLFKELHAKPRKPLILSNILDAGAHLIELRDTSAVATASAGEAWSLIRGNGEFVPAPLKARLAEESLDAEPLGEEAMRYSQLQNLFDGRE